LSSKFFSVFLFLIFFLNSHINTALGNQESIKISNLSHNISSKGKLLYKINAKSGIMDDFSSKTINLDLVEIELLENKFPGFKIFADKGKLNTKDKNLELYQNINGFNGQYKISCDKLFFKNDKKMIYLDGNIKIISALNSFSSEKGEIDIETNTITLKKNVKGILNEF
jgi:LPS export ABC transporter protein LptC